MKYRLICLLSTLLLLSNSVPVFAKAGKLTHKTQQFVGLRGPKLGYN